MAESGSVPRFASYDGTELAYGQAGSGPPLVCIPGGPGQAVAYLGDLGALDAYRTLVRLDNRGTGASAAPADPATYRVGRLVDDIEALRQHLGLDRMDLFGHSASGGTCLLYAARFPLRLHRLVLVSPSLRVAGMQSDVGVDEVLARRAGESWYADAVAALHAEARTPQEHARLKAQAAPLLYGAWTPAAQRHAQAEPAQFATAATDGFYAGFEPDPTVPERVTTPVLLVAGEHDIWPTVTSVRNLAARLPDATVVVQRGAGHFPWVDDPTKFSATVRQFLDRTMGS